MSIIMVSEALKMAFLPYIKSIQDFHFYYNNPLFWAFFMVLYLFLEIGWNWSPGRAFLFCAIMVSILLGVTYIEKLIIKTFTVQGYTAYILDPFILKVASLILISMVTIYFLFVDNI
jgi:hypothetical protein